MLTKLAMILLIVCFVSVLLVVTASGTEVTFVFLADPQLGGPNDLKPAQLSELNDVLNGIGGTPWPKRGELTDYPSHLKLGKALSCEGRQIGGIDGIFFGGDLSQSGGHAEPYAITEQTLRPPYRYNGGSSLRALRCLFEKVPLKYWDGKDMTGDSIEWYEITTKTDYKCYFGLGNHDAYEETQTVPWHGLTKIFDGIHFYRCQMWNFISQMHAGGYENMPNNLSERNAKYPVTSIDAPGSGSDYGEDCFDWTKYSFNYRVDLPQGNPVVSVFQLHTFGGDRQDGRDADSYTGLSWLLNQLAFVGKSRPIIIVQHFPLSKAKAGSSYGWTDAKRQTLLNFLSGYNVLAFLTGHTHSMNDFPKVYSGYKDFTAGICSVDYAGSPAQPTSEDRGCFALVRVTENTFDIVHGHLENGSIVWDMGYSKPVADPGGPYDLCGEGSPVTFDGANSSGRIVEYKWDLDGDGSYEAIAEAPIRTWMDNYVGDVKLSIRDDFGEFATATAQVTVVNVPPEVDVGEPFDEIVRGHRFTREGAFIDPGEDDPWTATVDYGDGSDEQDLILRPDKTFTLSHVYPIPGQYTLNVTVRDKDSGEGKGTIFMNVRKPRITKLKIRVSEIR